MRKSISALIISQVYSAIIHKIRLTFLKVLNLTVLQINKISEKLTFSVLKQSGKKCYFGSMPSSQTTLFLIILLIFLFFQL